MINDFSHDDEFDQPLRGTGASRFPTVKFNEVGDRFVGMVIDYDDKAPLYVYGTQQRKLTPSGKEATKDVLTVLIMAGTTAPVSDPDGGENAVLADPVGVVARVHIQGHNRWTPDERPAGQHPAWRNAIDASGEFRRGCVVRGEFQATSRIGSGGARLSQDKKIVGWQIRASKPEEAELTRRCREEFGRLRSAAAETAPVTVPSSRPAPIVDDSDAF